MEMNQKQKWFSLFAVSAFLLASCGTVDPGTASTGSSSSQPESSETDPSISSSMNSEESSIAESESSADESNSSSIVENPEAESGNESGKIVPGGSTELNQEEAAKIERAKAKISELTGYTEEAGYLFFIDDLQGEVVSISVREDGEEVASAVGYYRYDDRTDKVQELNIVTNEYEDFPASE